MYVSTHTNKTHNCWQSHSEDTSQNHATRVSILAWYFSCQDGYIQYDVIRPERFYIGNHMIGRTMVIRNKFPSVKFMTVFVPVTIPFLLQSQWNQRRIFLEIGRRNRRGQLISWCSVSKFGRNSVATTANVYCGAVRKFSILKLVKDRYLVKVKLKNQEVRKVNDTQTTTCRNKPWTI